MSCLRQLLLNVGTNVTSNHFAVGPRIEQETEGHIDRQTNVEIDGKTVRQIDGSQREGKTDKKRSSLAKRKKVMVKSQKNQCPWTN